MKVDVSIHYRKSQFLNLCPTSALISCKIYIWVVYLDREGYGCPRSTAHAQSVPVSQDTAHARKRIPLIDGRKLHKL